MKMNLGCGPVQPTGWINVDASNRAWLASRLPWLDRFLVICRVMAPTEFNGSTVYANLLRRFPWGDNAVPSIWVKSLNTSRR
jgi:hypothetical protein